MAKKLFTNFFEKKDKNDERTENQKKADLDKAVNEADQLLNDKKNSPKKIKAKLPALKAKYQLTSLQLIKDSDTEHHIEGEINPKGKGKKHQLSMGEKRTFELAAGELKSHEGHKILNAKGHPILDSEGKPKVVHIYTKHGPDVTEAELEDRLQQEVARFNNLRSDKLKHYEKLIAKQQDLLKDSSKGSGQVQKPEKVQQNLKKIAEYTDLLQVYVDKLTEYRSINEHDREAVQRALAELDKNKKPTYRATKFNNEGILVKAIMECLKNHKNKIDEFLIDQKTGEPKSNGTQFGPLRHKLGENIGIGYELSSNNTIRKMNRSLSQVSVIIIVTDSINFKYKVYTAFPE